VGRQVKDLAKLFYGRISSYDAALVGSPQKYSGAIEDALMRNAYADTVPDAARIARLGDYLQNAIARSRDWTGDEVLRAAIAFPDPAGE
jgi:hypothetical protein